MRLFNYQLKEEIMKENTKENAKSAKSNSSAIYVFYVTNTDSTGKVTHTWMAKLITGALGCHNTPSWNQFRYFTLEQAKTIKKELDKYQKLCQKNGSTYKSEFKIMSLKTAVNHTIKRMKELMETRELASYSDYISVKQRISADIKREEKGIKELPLYV